MKAADVPISSTWPEPMRPTRTAWSTVVTPLIARAANAAPRQEVLAAAGGAHHDGRGSARCRAHGEHRELKAEAEGQRGRRLLLGFVAQVPHARRRLSSSW